MTTIDVAIDDYLHTIVRTRPWTKKREEELLEGFSAWLQAQPAPPINMNEIGPALADQYAATVPLSKAEHTELLGALNHLFMWSVHTAMAQHNPFATVAA